MWNLLKHFGVFFYLGREKYAENIEGESFAENIEKESFCRKYRRKTFVEKIEKEAMQKT